jgi:hypothetical protein
MLRADKTPRLFFYSLDWLIMSGLALFVSERGSKGGAILDLW